MKVLNGVSNLDLFESQSVPVPVPDAEELSTASRANEVNADIADDKVAEPAMTQEISSISGDKKPIRTYKKISKKQYSSAGPDLSLINFDLLIARADGYEYKFFSEKQIIAILDLKIKPEIILEYTEQFPILVTKKSKNLELVISSKLAEFLRIIDYRGKIYVKKIKQKDADRYESMTLSPLYQILESCMFDKERAKKLITKEVWTSFSNRTFNTKILAGALGFSWPTFWGDKN